MEDTTNNGVPPQDDAKEEGYYLRWSRLRKQVEVNDLAGGGLMGGGSISASFHAGKKADGEGTKVILDDVSGCAKPGEVLACMGPSGSGKTSLMNALSGRSSFQDGTISINGRVLGASGMKRLMTKVAYVKQADVFFEHLSVRDQLTYTALLRLPTEMTTADKHMEVDRLLRALRLNKVEDSAIKMISGGEKKRVNIGSELLTNPFVLLLDEPTSGLDSTSAVSLLNLLKTLAKDHNKTIITSIHQPSSAVFQNSFDKLIMLSEGHVVYFGKPVESLQYLQLHNLPCPEGYNAADHWMDMLVIDSAVEEERKEEEGALMKEDVPSQRAELGQTSPRFLLQKAWDGEAVAEQMDAELIDNDNASVTSLKTEIGSKYATTWWTQFTILMHRALKNSRSAIFTWLNLLKSLAIGIIVGLLWYQKEYTEADVNDIRSYYFFTMTFWVFDSMYVESFSCSRLVSHTMSHTMLLFLGLPP
jgi:ABC-type multidrug transport system ATPase subunit